MQQPTVRFVDPAEALHAGADDCNVRFDAWLVALPGSPHPAGELLANERGHEEIVRIQKVDDAELHLNVVLEAAEKGRAL